MTTTNPFETLRVLYLEDEALIAFDTSQHLEELGFKEVTCAYRLRHAEQAAENQHYDLAIFDINVDANQTSIALGEKLAEKGTRVIFASGSTRQAKGMARKGYHNLGKPFSLDVLTRTVEEALFNSA